jgi:acetyl-CoA carboxylase biotin carboxyl carrier protein
MKIQLDDLKALISALEAGKVAEFEYEDENSRIRLSFGAKAPAVSVAAVAASPAPAVSVASAAAAAAPVDEAKVAYIVSPIVGTFYRSPSPESPPFADVGNQVKVGQAVCIVEAMKLMNEIESDVAGTVLEVLVENGHSVEFGQRLFKIKKSD